MGRWADPHLTSLAGLESSPDCAELGTALWEMIQTYHLHITSQAHHLPGPSPPLNL